MAKLPVLSAREVLKALERAGFERIFDEHAEQLKRWNGSRKGLGGVDDVLESLLRRYGPPRGLKGSSGARARSVPRQVPSCLGP